MLWSRGIARQALMGAERTSNPFPAAVSMIGKARVARASRVYYAKRASKPHYKGNPVPALLLGLAPKLGITGLIGGGPDAAKQKLRIAKLDDYAYQVINTKGAAGQEALMHLQAIAQRQEGHGVAINDPIVNHARELVDAIKKAATPPPASTAQKALSVLQQPGTIGAIAALSATQKKQGFKYDKYGNLTQKVFNGYNPNTGKPRYKQVPVGQGGIPGAGAAAGLAPAALGGASFLGTVGAGGAALTAAQLATAGAAGVGAYFVTQKLLQYLGGKALSAEEAGVAASLAHREALQKYPAQKDQINAAWRNQLIELGYDPVTFTRKRSGLENFLSDYNPFD